MRTKRRKELRRNEKRGEGDKRKDDKRVMRRGKEETRGKVKRMKDKRKEECAMLWRGGGGGRVYAILMSLYFKPLVNFFIMIRGLLFLFLLLFVLSGDSSTGGCSPQTERPRSTP